MKYKIAVSLTVILVVLLTVSSPAFAHRMIIDYSESGLVQVIYDDNLPAKRAEVTFFDENNNEVFRGKVDDKGFLEYDTGLSPVFVIANDGLGHQVEADLTIEPKKEMSVQLKAILGVGFLVSIAAFFHFFTLKPKQQ